MTNTYECYYQHDDETYSFQVTADTWESAEEQAKRVRDDAVVKGVIV